MQIQPEQKRNRGRRWTIAGLSAAIVAIVVFVAIAALNGIIGNRADNFLLWLLGWINQIKIDLLPWVIAGITLGICLIVICWFLWRLVHLSHRILNLEQENSRIPDLEQENRVLRHALETEQNIVLLDDSLLRLLASWIPARDHEQEMKLILSELLSDATAEFNGHVHRAAILRPDGDCLKIWTHYGIPDDTVRLATFYIGPDRGRQHGVAGAAFLNQELRVGHMMQAAGGWICDDPNFTSGRRRPFPPYRSFVAIPIIGVSPTITAGNTIECFGVMCFDSLQPDIFDSPANQALLRTFARRVAAALIIFKQLP